MCKCFAAQYSIRKNIFTDRLQYKFQQITPSFHLEVLNRDDYSV